MQNLYKTILINLKKDTDRLKFMVNQLNNLNIKFERFEAVHGKEYIETGGSEYDEKLVIKKAGKIMTLGEIGCTLSHKRCYERFLNHPEYKYTKYLLILEDDVELDKNFKIILENEIKKNEEKYKWNYLQFNYPNYKNFRDLLSTNIKKFSWQISIIRSKKTLIHKIKRIPFLILGPFISFLLDIIDYFFLRKHQSYKQIRIKPLTGAYLLDKKAATYIFDNMKYLTEIIDVFLIHELQISPIECYFYKPLIAKQKTSDFKSSINHIESRF